MTPFQHDMPSMIRLQRLLVIVAIMLCSIVMSGCFGSGSGSSGPPPSGGGGGGNSNALTITTANMPGAATGTPYFVQFNATGGTPPYVFTDNAQRPSGLVLAANGALGGTPTSTGVFTYALTVTDSLGVNVTRTYNFAVVTGGAGGGGGGGPSIAPTALPPGVVGSAYLATIGVSGGQAPYTWSVGAGLPGGMSINNSGQVLGFLGSAGVFQFTVTVTDANTQSDSRQLSLIVNTTPSNLQVSSTNLGNATTGAPYVAQLTASGGLPPYSWSVASGLPTGLVVSAAGVISGIPSQAGNFVFLATVTDATNFGANSNVLISVVTPHSARDLASLSAPAEPDVSSKWLLNLEVPDEVSAELASGAVLHVTSAGAMELIAAPDGTQAFAGGPDSGTQIALATRADGRSASDELLRSELFLRATGRAIDTLQLWLVDRDGNLRALDLSTIQGTLQPDPGE